MESSRNADGVKYEEAQRSFWSEYVKQSAVYDGELVEGLNGDLDIILIFVRRIPILWSRKLVFILTAGRSLLRHCCRCAGRNIQIFDP
jgi:hypothetical protein